MNDIKDTYFVVYNPKNIMYFTNEAPFTGYINSGYHIVPYVTDYVKELYKGTYLQCMIVFQGLVSFSIN